MILKKAESNKKLSESINSMEEKIESKISAYIRSESILTQRFANGCLIISLMLFISQSVISAYANHHDLMGQISLILTGYCFSFLLFYTWLSVTSIFTDSIPKAVFKTDKVSFWGLDKFTIIGWIKKIHKDPKVVCLQKNVGYNQVTIYSLR